MTELTADVYNARKINLQHQLTAAKTNLAELALVAERGGKADIKGAKDDIASLIDLIETLDIAWGQEQANAVLRVSAEQEAGHNEQVEAAKRKMGLRAQDVVHIQATLDTLVEWVRSFIINDRDAMNAIRDLLGESDLRVVETWLENQHLGAFILGALTRAGLHNMSDHDGINMARAFEGTTLVAHDTSRMNQVISRASRTVPGLRPTEEN
jgi:hypothetical protein